MAANHGMAYEAMYDLVIESDADGGHSDRIRLHHLSKLGLWLLLGKIR